MITRTSAIVLRVSPYSATSHVVTWMTPDHGRIATVVKGACRPKSPFLGQYDYFYTCELLYYDRERNGLHIAGACHPLNVRLRLRADWRAFAYASYMCGLILRISMPGVNQSEIFHLLQRVLDRLCFHGAEPQVLFWFEQRFSVLLGLAPRLDRCAACDARLSHGAAALFSAAQGGVLCPACGNELPEQAIIPVSPDIRAILARWQKAEEPHVPAATRCTNRQLLVIRRILGTFLGFHLDLVPQCRAIALDIARSANGYETATADFTDRRGM